MKIICQTSNLLIFEQKSNFNLLSVGWLIFVISMNWSELVILAESPHSLDRILKLILLIIFCILIAKQIITVSTCTIDRELNNITFTRKIWFIEKKQIHCLKEIREIWSEVIRDDEGDRYELNIYLTNDGCLSFAGVDKEESEKIALLLRSFVSIDDR